MIDYKDRISSHHSNDEWRHYEFSRRSGLPWGYFRRGLSVDAVVFVALTICLILGMAFAWATQ
jgi:hypothetical protein